MLSGTVLVLSFSLLGAGLDGTTVFVSPGHGFYFHSTLGWITQRGARGSIVEDLETADTVFAFLVEYLRRGGADVWPCRCESPTALEVVVDNGDPGYEEEGSWQNTSSGGYGGTARYATAGPGSPAVARYRPIVPESGRYPLYVWFISGSNRASDALVRIRHAGGTEAVRITQQRDGWTWRYVGTYFFFAGRGQYVEISADSDDTGKVVIADAVRIGGGLGSVEPNAGGDTSGRLRYEECSVYWARYQGAPASVFNASADGDATDDVTCRPRYAEFESESGERAIYLSYHTNGGGGTGTETYSYAGDATPGSRTLRNLLQREIVDDLRTAWDPSWVDRGVKEANFGELRLLQTMPGALIESAFHDHPDDLVAERSPRWRKIVSRAIYHGVSRYVLGDGAPLLPEPPRRLSARADGSGSVRLAWSAPPYGAGACGAGRAERYRIDSSANGLAFSAIRETGSTTARITGLPAGTPLFFRVTALNAGGASLPSRTAAVVLPDGETPLDGLLIHAFSEDEGTYRRVAFTSDVLGDVLRLEPGRKPGGGDSAVEHIWALRTAREAFAWDFAEMDTLSAVSLESYDLIVLAFGDQREEVLSESRARTVASYLDQGGRIILSGAHIATAIAEGGGNEARAFLAQAGVTAVGETTAPARLVPRDLFDAMGSFVIGTATDWHLSSTQEFDVVAPSLGGRSAIRSDAGDAAITLPGSSVFFSVPLEAVPQAAVRAALCERALASLFGEPELPPPDLPDSLENLVLENGFAEVTIEASGPPALRYLWSQAEGPPGAAAILTDPWPLGRSGIGYGDDDDVTVMSEEDGQCPSLLMRRAFRIHSRASVESLVLDVRYDDGFVAYINGGEVARRNVAAGGDPSAWAEGAIEPIREEIELYGTAFPLLCDGENILAISFHNASPDSSDLTADIALRAVLTGREQVFVIPPGAVWHAFPCGQEADAGWHLSSFDPSGRVATIVVTEPGSYLFSVMTESLTARSEPAAVAVRVLPEGGLVAFIRGDANSDGAVDLADAISILQYLFAGGPGPCLAAQDTNGSGGIDIADAIFLLEYLFVNGAVPPLPGPDECGLPPDGEDLGCDRPAERCR